eukprot:7380505-Prymnesium_polylepis.1
MEEPTEPQQRAAKQPLSVFSASSPVSIHHPTTGYVDVPRDRETVIWFAWRMPVGGLAVNLWFHSHSTTSVEGHFGLLALAPGERAPDVWNLRPTYAPIDVVATGYTSVSALRDRIMGRAQLICTFKFNYELISSHAVPRAPSMD